MDFAEYLYYKLRKYKGSLDKKETTLKYIRRSINCYKETYAKLPEMDIKDILNINEKMDDLCVFISKYFRIDVEDLKGTERDGDMVKARRIFFYICKRVYNIGYAKAGRHINRDHATALHHTKKFEAFLESFDEEMFVYKQIFDLLKIEDHKLNNAYDKFLKSEEDKKNRRTQEVYANLKKITNEVKYHGKFLKDAGVFNK